MACSSIFWKSIFFCSTDTEMKANSGTEHQGHHTAVAAVDSPSQDS
jgi:hypothetical protein